MFAKPAREEIQKIMQEQRQYYQVPTKKTDRNISSLLIISRIRELSKDIMNVNGSKYYQDFYKDMFFLRISHMFRCSEITSDAIYRLIKKNVPVSAELMLVINQKKLIST